MTSNYLPGVHHRPHPYSQSLLRNLRQVTIKEPSVGHNGVLVQGLYPGPRYQTGARLIECDVTVRANS